MENSTNYSRRQFLKTGSIFAGGLFIPFYVSGAFKNSGNKMLAAETLASSEILIPNSFLRIGADNTVTIVLTHCEMGQGISTSLSMLIAEELDADWNSIKTEEAPAAVEYYHSVYGIQRTGGSSSLMSEFDRYRTAGATGRLLLVQAAAKKFNVGINDIRTENGYVILSNNKRVPYGALVEEASKLTIPKEVPLKDPSQWKLITRGAKRLDTVIKSNGQAKFGMDVQFPGLLTAVVARNIMQGAKVKSYDKAAALKISGVREVVEIPQGVAVLADHFWAAKKGRDALNVQWDLGKSKTINSKDLLLDFKKRADGGGAVAVDKGNLSQTFKKSNRIVEAEYF